VRAVVYIPAGFEATFLDRSPPGTEMAPAAIRLYTDPAATFTPGIIRSVVTQITNGFISAGAASSIVSGRLETDARAVGPAMLTIGPRLANVGELLAAEIEAGLAPDSSGSRIQLNRIPVAGENGNGGFNPLAFFAPSMGLMFLTFSLFYAARSVLEEQDTGTLTRLLISPTGHAEILLGKIGGVFMSGLLQFTVFVAVSSVVFRLSWTDSIPALALLTVAIVAALTSLGAILAAFARDATQANIFGSVVALLFAALGGNFIPAQFFPPWLQTLSQFTITRWALDGLSALSIQRAGVVEILPEVAVLLAIALVCFVIAITQFQKRIVQQ
jgi:ABC-2 type transport system permease protein